jgi:tetrahydromethanopterin S-methyltransferase subunit D
MGDICTHLKHLAGGAVWHELVLFVILNVLLPQLVYVVPVGVVPAGKKPGKDEQVRGGYKRAGGVTIFSA